MCSSAHTVIAVIGSASECPSAVSSYSTRGGTSAYAVRVSSPSRSSLRSGSVSTLGATPPTRPRRWLKRSGPSRRTSTIRAVHLSLMRSSTARLGQSGLWISGFMVTLKYSVTKRYRDRYGGSRTQQAGRRRLLHDGVCWEPRESGRRPLRTPLHPAQPRRPGWPGGLHRLREVAAQRAPERPTPYQTRHRRRRHGRDPRPP